MVLFAMVNMTILLELPSFASWARISHDQSSVFISPVYWLCFWPTAAWNHEESMERTADF
jgi:hypothetical protein